MMLIIRRMIIKLRRLYAKYARRLNVKQQKKSDIECVLIVMISTLITQIGL